MAEFEEKQHAQSVPSAESDNGHEGTDPQCQEHQHESKHSDGSHCNHDGHEHEHGHHDGHGHGHGHGQNHCCGHDHEHHHDHEHENCTHDQTSETDSVAGFNLTVMVHEEAVVSSLSIELTGPADAVENRIFQNMEELVERMESAGAMIGHIKAALTPQTPITTFASVGKSLTSKRHDPSTFKLELAAIVFFLETDQCQEFVTKFAKQLSAPIFK